MKAVTIAQVGDFFLYAPIYVAIDAGLLEKRGIAARLVSTGGDEKTWTAVLLGDAHFGVGDPTFVAISDSRGQAGRVIASVVNGVPFWGVTYKSAISPFATAAALRGRSVATFPAPSTAYALQTRMFQDAKVRPNIRQGAFGALLNMAKTGTVDIALELEPNVSTAVRDGAKVVYSLAEAYGDFAITGLIVRPSFLRSDSTTVFGTVCAIQEALDFIRGNPDSALAILRKRFAQVDSSVARLALERVTREGIVPQSVVIGDSAWTRATRLRLENGDLAEIKGMEEYVDNGPAKRAASECRVAGR